MRAILKLVHVFFMRKSQIDQNVRKALENELRPRLDNYENICGKTYWNTESP